MGLTRTDGPLSPYAPTTVNYAIDGPPHKLLMHPFPRRVRAEFAGRTVLDTRGGFLLHESNLLPVLYVPEADLDQVVALRRPVAEHGAGTPRPEQPFDARAPTKALAGQEADLGPVLAAAQSPQLVGEQLELGAPLGGEVPVHPRAAAATRGVGAGRSHRNWRTARNTQIRRPQSLGPARCSGARSR